MRLSSAKAPDSQASSCILQISKSAAQQLSPEAQLHSPGMIRSQTIIYHRDLHYFEKGYSTPSAPVLFTCTPSRHKHNQNLLSSDFKDAGANLAYAPVLRNGYIRQNWYRSCKCEPLLFKTCFYRVKKRFYPD